MLEIGFKAQAKPEQCDIALVSMPFASYEGPSIQLGLLKAIAASKGFSAESIHLNLDFVSLIGVSLYKALTEHRGTQVGDWLFSTAAFGSDAPDPEAKFLEKFWGQLSHLHRIEGVDRPRLAELRDEVLPTMLDYITASIDWANYRVIGFTSTFQQNVASIALARRIKAQHPDSIILFGGANFESPMGEEWMRSLPWIDYAITGEADQTLPELLAALCHGTSQCEMIPGVLSRDASGTLKTGPRPEPFSEMDSLPTPDYSEYFDRASELHLLSGEGRRHVLIPFESARGCWWGMKNHCTFCGLNGQSMSFRSKSPTRVLNELAELARCSHSFHFAAVDNILDMKFFSSLLPAMQDSKATYELFYEVKSNISKAQIRQLALSGVRQVQPGIESLSTSVLSLMRKGVTAIQNVNMLRWCQHYNIHASWNIIWGFPGESNEDYEYQVSLIQKLVHLRPPSGCGRLWLERFSPMFQNRDIFLDLKDMAPEASYAYVYPTFVKLENAAYFFDYSN